MRQEIQEYASIVKKKDKKMEHPLRKIRKERKKTLREIAENTGIGLSTIGNYEKGTYGISQENLKKIADFLDCHIDAIRPVDDDNPSQFSCDSLSKKKVNHLRGCLTKEEQDRYLMLIERETARMEEAIIEYVRSRLKLICNIPERYKEFQTQINNRLDEYYCWCQANLENARAASSAQAQKDQEAERKNNP